MNIENEVKELAARYADCGIDEAAIWDLMRDKDTPSGLDDRAKLIGVRLCLGMEFNRQELFSMDDLCHITGESAEQVMERMRAAGVTPITISLAPCLKGE